jgi:UDP-glucose 4-epimerase
VTTPAMRLLVIGGTGFVGSSFANWAARHGATVFVCARSPSKIHKLSPEVEFLVADATDVASLRRAFDRARPTVVLFAVSQILPRSEKVASFSSVAAEIRSLLNSLECIVGTSCKKLLYLSSAGAVYGEGPNAFHEEDRCSPKSLYGRMKLQAEQLLALLAPRAGVTYSILRVSNPYGPGQNPFGSQGVIAIFINKVLRGEGIQIFGNDQSRKDYIYIDDLNRAIAGVIDHCDGQLFNLGFGASTKLADLIDIIERECDLKAVRVPSSLAEVEVESFDIDVTRAQRILDWKPEVAIEAGIRLTREWIESLTQSQT